MDVVNCPVGINDEISEFSLVAPTESLDVFLADRRDRGSAVRDTGGRFRSPRETYPPFTLQHQTVVSLFDHVFCENFCDPLVGFGAVVAALTALDVERLHVVRIEALCDIDRLQFRKSLVEPI